MQTVRRRQDAGLAAPPLSRHLVFAGNPGTGKTTVARLRGRLLAALGMLERGHLVEADRTAMVGENVGHTGSRTITLVVVLTDSKDQGSRFAMSTATFLTTLKASENPSRPVPIIAVGYGADADRHWRCSADGRYAYAPR